MFYLLDGRCGVKARIKTRPNSWTQFLLVVVLQLDLRPIYLPANHPLLQRNHPLMVSGKLCAGSGFTSTLKHLPPTTLNLVFFL